MKLALVPFLESAPIRADTALAQRVLDAFPSGSYALSALLRLMDIEASTEVATAAVECRIQPRLLINPDFVARHAPSPEKLLMLVMHELHHVLLGHTTLFPRCTPVQNFVFDAVINGVICRMFPQPPYTAFLTDYYDSASYPHCLLRPPPGWPGRKCRASGIANLSTVQANRVNEIHQALYSSTGASYQEVFEALPKLLDDPGLKLPSLLGGHQGASEGELEKLSPLLFDTVRSIVEQWPQPPDPIKGRSLAEVLKTQTVHPAKVPHSARQGLRGLMRKVAGVHASGQVRQSQLDNLNALTPIPSMGRRSMVLRALGHEPLLHVGPTPWLQSVRSGERVHVYLDVSGSMDLVMQALYGAVLDCAAFVHSTVHLFSSKVVDVSLAELRRGVCRTTGGTDIVCVARHMQDHRVHRAVLVTDGWVGAPRGGHHEVLKKVRLGVAYMGKSPNQTDLQAVANDTVVLPTGA